MANNIFDASAVSTYRVDTLVLEMLRKEALSENNRGTRSRKEGRIQNLTVARLKLDDSLLLHTLFSVKFICSQAQRLIRHCRAYVVPRCKMRLEF